MIDSRHRSYRCFLLHIRIISAGLVAMLWICGRAYAQPDTAQLEPGEQHPIVVDPASLDFGRIQAYVRYRTSLRLTNTADVSITVLRIINYGPIRFLGGWPKTLEPGQSANFDFYVLPRRRPGTAVQARATVALEGEVPGLRLKFQGETYADVALTPRRLRLDEDPTGRITLSATDGEPFRVLAVYPPRAVGLVDEPKLRHELFLPLDRFEHKARRFTIYLDKPTCNVVSGFIHHRGWTPKEPQTPDEKLIYALSELSPSGAEAALRAGANPSAVSASGSPALLFTATSLYRTLPLQTLLDAGAAIDATNTMGQTALMLAVIGGSSDNARMLVDRGASVGMRDVVGGTALMRAARYGDHSTIEMLLAAGADPEAVDKLGLRALHWASLRGNRQTTKALLDNQADVNAQSEGRLLTPLMFAARRGYTEVINDLLEAGADVEAIDNAGRTALMWALKESHPEAARILQDAGTEQPRVDQERTPVGDTPIDSVP